MAENEDADAGGAAEGAAETPKKKSAMGGLILGLGLAVALGAGVAYGVKSGLVPIPGVDDGAAETAEAPETEEIAPAPSFLALDPLTVTFGQAGAPRQLRLALSIETSEAYLESVEANRPRILDALNTLLRAVDEDDLAQPWALDRLRAQMLRRIRIATDPTAIQDLLITEYVIF